MANISKEQESKSKKRDGKRDILATASVLLMGLITEVLSAFPPLSDFYRYFENNGRVFLWILLRALVVLVGSSLILRLYDKRKGRPAAESGASSKENNSGKGEDHA